MVVAGAGSGKTRVITCRIVSLIKEKQVAPENILAITFTNKAANEMRERVYRMLGPAAQAPWISTFHSFCLRILRHHIHHLGYSADFVVFDAQDQLSLIKQCMKSAGINHEAFPPKSILNHISGFKDESLFPEDIDVDSLTFGNKMKAAQLYPVYQKTLKDNNALDFDDLLILCVRLLSQQAEVADFYSERFRHILVDEFQDTNLTQYQLVRLLSGTHNNVCVVGDDDQSIYQWRGANIENFLNFERSFPGTRVIKLEENYRSTQNILKAAGAVVRENLNRKEKTLWTKNDPGAPVIYYRAIDEVDEADNVCQHVLKLNREDNISFNDMAVLYRTNAQSRVVEDELRKSRIPYQVIGGFRFYERKEIKDILAYMRVVLNPADSVSLKRIINMPLRGIGKTSMEKIDAHCREHQKALFDGLRVAAEQRLTSPAINKKIGEFVALIDHLRNVYEHQSGTEFLDEIIEKTGYADMLEKEGTLESRTRLENLKELGTAVEQFIEKEEGKTLHDFLDTTALVADVDNMKDERGVLPLMTLHSCKGLEFDAVFVIGVENGLLPHSSSMNSNQEYEEERRLCYVGFTRAKRKLLISNARRRKIYGNSFNYLPSDFLASIPEEILKYETPAVEREAYSRNNSPFFPSQSYVKSAPSLDSPTDSDSEYAVGTKVLHPSFGNGVVIKREGRDDDLKVVVFFKNRGKKKLAVNHANMIVV